MEVTDGMGRTELLEALRAERDAPGERVAGLGREGLDLSSPYPVGSPAGSGAEPQALEALRLELAKKTADHDTMLATLTRAQAYGTDVALFRQAVCKLLVDAGQPGLAKEVRELRVVSEAEEFLTSKAWKGTRLEYPRQPVTYMDMVSAYPGSVIDAAAVTERGPESVEVPISTTGYKYPPTDFHQEKKE